MQAYADRRMRVSDMMAYWTSHFLELAIVPFAHSIIL